MVGVRAARYLDKQREIVSREEYFASIIMNDIKYASFLSPPTHALS
jgi:hypothetical protein